MNSIITSEQARQITGGRKPLVPVCYEAAVKALQECIDLDDAKIWVDKSDALAAWAKIYHDGKVSRQAAQLKLRAYRRMGELAAELRPQTRKRRSDGKLMGKANGPASLLRERGLGNEAAFSAMRISRIPATEFEDLLGHPRIPSPIRLMRSAHWGSVELGCLLSSVSSFRSACRKISASEAANVFLRCGITDAQRAVFIEVNDWLDEFFRNLDKSASGKQKS